MFFFHTSFFIFLLLIIYKKILVNFARFYVLVIDSISLIINLNLSFFAILYFSVITLIYFPFSTCSNNNFKLLLCLWFYVHIVDFSFSALECIPNSYFPASCFNNFNVLLFVDHCCLYPLLVN